MLKYFETEMRLLREAAQDFAEQHPEQARMLNLQTLSDRDPYIERLIEGVAYCTAKIHQKIDDDLPEISEGLLLQLWPHLLRPFPAATIMQFSPATQDFQKPITIPKGTELKNSPNAEQQTYKFQTTAATTINPLYLHDANIIPQQNGDTEIELQFNCMPNTTITNSDLSDFNLHVHANSTTAAILHYALTACVRQVSIEFKENEQQNQIVLGTQNIIQASNLNSENTLIPQSSRSFTGFHLLHEYFLFPEKYLFVNINSLNTIAWPKNCDQFKIKIHTRYSFTQDHAINKDMFRLYCTPAINLFQATSIPICHDHKHFEYPVFTETEQNSNSAIYSVDEVIGVEDSGKRQLYHPLASFKHQPTGHNYYHTTQRHDRYYLSLGQTAHENIEYLSCSITCTNGNQPRRNLQEHQIDAFTSDEFKNVRPDNITRPSPMYKAPDRSDYNWTLLANLSLNYRSLTKIDTLRQLLQAYDWSGSEVNHKYCNGIDNIEAQVINKVQHGALVQGVKFILSMNEEKFPSRADMHLFGLVLHHLFCMYTNVNQLVMTQIICHPSNKEFLWSQQGTKNPV